MGSGPPFVRGHSPLPLDDAAVDGVDGQVAVDGVGSVSAEVSGPCRHILFQITKKAGKTHCSRPHVP